MFSTTKSFLNLNAKVEKKRSIKARNAFIWTVENSILKTSHNVYCPMTTKIHFFFFFFHRELVFVSIKLFFFDIERIQRFGEKKDCLYKHSKTFALLNVSTRRNNNKNPLPSSFTLHHTNRKKLCRFHNASHSLFTLCSCASYKIRLILH